MHEHISEHITELKKLWHEVFGDAPYVIDTYFNIFYSPDLTAAEYIDGELAAAAYVMPAGELVGEKCAHIYAVAVYPKFRGRGLGIAVTNRAVEKAKAAGYTAVILHPASESLFGYYEKHCGFHTCFYSATKTVAASAAPLEEADIETYISCREKYLKDIPHVELSRGILDFFTKCGGKLYISETGCAAVENIDGALYFREALGDIGAENAVLCCPYGDTPTGMIHGKAAFESGWMGLTLE